MFRLSLGKVQAPCATYAVDVQKVIEELDRHAFGVRAHVTLPVCVSNREKGAVNPACSACGWSLPTNQVRRRYDWRSRARLARADTPARPPRRTLLPSGPAREK